MNSTKNLLMIIVVLIILLGVSLFYNPFNKTEAVRPFLNTNTYNDKDGSVSKLDVKLIQTMVNNYRSNQLKLIEGSLKKPDAQSVWFDLKTIKDFITQIEKTTKKTNSKIDSNLLGLRMYYASYPSGEDMGAYLDLESTPKSYERMHTVIMIPTIKIDKVNVDYNPIDASTYKKGAKIITNNDKASNNRVYKMMAVGSEETSALNHGHLSPPNRSSIEEEN